MFPRYGTSRAPPIPNERACWNPSRHVTILVKRGTSHSFIINELPSHPRNFHIQEGYVLQIGIHEPHQWREIQIATHWKIFNWCMSRERVRGKCFYTFGSLPSPGSGGCRAILHCVARVIPHVIFPIWYLHFRDSSTCPPGPLKSSTFCFSEAGYCSCIGCLFWRSNDLPLGDNPWSSSLFSLFSLILYFQLHFCKFMQKVGSKLLPNFYLQFSVIYVGHFSKALLDITPRIGSLRWYRSTTGVVRSTLRGYRLLLCCSLDFLCYSSTSSPEGVTLEPPHTIPICQGRLVNHLANLPTTFAKTCANLLERLPVKNEATSYKQGVALRAYNFAFRSLPCAGRSRTPRSKGSIVASSFIYLNDSQPTSNCTASFSAT